MKRYEITLVVSADDDDLYPEPEQVLHSAQAAIATNTEIWPYEDAGEIREITGNE